MTEIRIRRNSLAYDTQKKIRKEKNRKALLREKEQEIQVQEESRISLDEEIIIIIADFLAYEEQEEEYVLEKVS